MAWPGYASAARQLVRIIGDPCITVYLGLETSYPAAAQNALKYRALVKEVEDKLVSPDSGLKKSIQDTLYEFFDETKFARHRGVAIFVSPDHFSHLYLPSRVQDLAVVDSRFYTRPLLELASSGGSYHLLAITQNRAQLYEGWQDTLEVVTVSGLPRTLQEVVSGADLEKSSVHLHASSAGGSRSIYHSPGEAKADIKTDVQQFFRAVDTRLRSYFKDARRPLVLATLAHYVPLYREISRLPNLLAAEVVSHGDHISTELLGSKAWEIVENHHRDSTAANCEKFGAARARGLGSDDLNEVARLAAAGRVETLLIDESCRVWGEIDRSTGTVKEEESFSNGHHGTEVLGAIAELVFARDGTVSFLPRERFPASGPVAAICRY